MTTSFKPWAASTFVTLSEPEEPTCAWCDNPAHKVNYLFGNKRHNVFICDNCVTDLFMRLDKMNALVMCDHSEMTRQ